MASLQLSGWTRVEVGDAKLETRMRFVDFSNKLFILVCQGPNDRISSYVEANRKASALSHFADIDVAILMGDRNEVWTQVIARRAVELAGKDILFGFGLNPKMDETHALGLSNAINQQIAKRYQSAS